ncbi:hypothetical protein HN958_01190 [Candidatus Falkowbacteria bacterium]|jgi:hypothetical protein|nr:hypothetical protein [Candidatus Falkowbacteria bacterium]
MQALNTRELKHFETAIEECVELVLKQFARQLDLFEGNLNDVIDCNTRGAQQPLKGCYVGDDALFSLAMDCSCAGVLSRNLTCHLFDEGVHWKITPIAFIAIRRAMDRDSQLNDWIRSIVAGAKVCDKIKLDSGKYAPDNERVQLGPGLEKLLMD